MVPALCVVLVIGLFMLIAAYVKSATSECAVTSRRAIIKAGFISRAQPFQGGVDRGRAGDYGTNLWLRRQSFG